MQKPQLNKLTIITATLGGILFLLLLSTMVSVVKAGPSSSAPRAYMTLTGTPPKPTISLSYNRPVTSSGASCRAEEGPEKAVNGTWFATFWNGHWYGDNWCSNLETKWMQIDLGQNYYITQIVIYHASAKGGSSAEPYNTRDYSIYGIQDNPGPWSQLKTIKSVTNNVAGMNWFNFAVGINAPTARFIRVKVTNGAQPGQANVARIYDVLVYGTPAP